MARPASWLLSASLIPAWLCLGEGNKQSRSYGANSCRRLNPTSHQSLTAIQKLLSRKTCVLCILFSGPCVFDRVRTPDSECKSQRAPRLKQSEPRIQTNEHRSPVIDDCPLDGLQDFDERARGLLGSAPGLVWDTSSAKRLLYRGLTVRRAAGEIS